MRLSDIAVGGTYEIPRNGGRERVTVAKILPREPRVYFRRHEFSTTPYNVSDPLRISEFGKTSARNLRPMPRPEWLETWACCDLAVPTACVCAYSWTCPRHGERHVGTHE